MPACPPCLSCRLLDSLPDVELASHLPALLPGLLGMLSDANPEIRSACTKLLQVCLCVGTSPLRRAVLPPLLALASLAQLGSMPHGYMRN